MDVLTVLGIRINFIRARAVKLDADIQKKINKPK